jgi:hypothetical protein
MQNKVEIQKGKYKANFVRNLNEIQGVFKMPEDFI